MCFRNVLEFERGTMSLDIFKSITARLKAGFGDRGPDYVNFVGLGEILLNPELLAILRHFKEIFPRAKANISTNLRRFDEGLFTALSTEGLADRISVSVDDTEDRGPFYHSYAGATTAALESLARLNAAADRPAGLRLQAVMISKEQALRVIALAARHGARIVNLNRLTQHAIPPGKRVRRPSVEQEKEILRCARAAAAPLGIEVWNNNTFNLFMKLASAGDRFCLITDDHLFIDVTGRALPCFCLRGEAWGSLMTSSLAELYSRKPDFYSLQPDVCGCCDVYKNAHRH
jgi:MoaA/NifB/PqqE/SkfB family radical SAM enzyme